MWTLHSSLYDRDINKCVIFLMTVNQNDFLKKRWVIYKSSKLNSISREKVWENFMYILIFRLEDGVDVLMKQNARYFECIVIVWFTTTKMDMNKLRIA